MRELLYQIGRGFAFGGVRHPELTQTLRWVPVTFACSTALIYLAVPVKPLLVGEGSLSRDLIGVFSTLPGFFIAALAAVATFNRSEMDMTMPEPAPKLQLKVGNERDWVELTFRMFLSHLFGYLTTLSFVAEFFFLGVDLLSGSGNDLFHRAIPLRYLDISSLYINSLYVFVACWFGSKIIITTLLGIYFLAERIHRPAA